MRTQPCKEQWELMCNTVRAEYLGAGFVDPTIPLDERTVVDQVMHDDPEGLHGVERSAGKVCPKCGSDAKVSVPWLHPERGALYCEGCEQYFGVVANEDAAPRGGKVIVLVGELRALIEREDDVKRVMELEPIRGGRFRYMIETPFETFPKFVIGTTDGHFEDIRLEHRCGAEWNARRIWLDREMPPVNLESGVE